MNNVTSSIRPISETRPMRLALRSVSLAVVLAFGLSGCQSLNDLVGGDKVDYRGAAKTGKSLDVPPDLTQLSTDNRYQPSASRGAVNASDFSAAVATQTTGAGTGTGTGTTATTVAPNAVGETRVERLGTQRYLYVPMTPEQVWPQLEAFWQERTLALTVNKPEVGVMETEWAENRAKIHTDLLRRTIGKVFDGLFSTNTLDKFRVRVERSPTGNGSEIYLTQSGLEEIVGGPMKDQSAWSPRPRDYHLESEILSLIMLKLGVKPEQAKAIIAAGDAAPAPAARARTIDGRPSATMHVDDAFDRAWRRVGLALDRSGFTVEDRDRVQGLYFVRYVDPASAGREEPGFLSRLFGGDKKKADNALARYRVVVKGEGDMTEVSVQNGSGAPENGEAGQRIVRFLVEELK